MNTLEIVKENETKSVSVEEFEKLGKLSKSVGSPYSEMFYHLKYKSNLLEQFTEIIKVKPLIVDENIVKRFKYCAALDGYSVKIGKEKYIRYSGDIPDFVLDRLTVVKEFRQKERSLHNDIVTIHSNNPLPIEIIKFVKIDPVVIYWLDRNFSIRRNIFGKFAAIGESEGIVLGMWDMDKEIKEEK